MEFWPEFLANSWGREFIAGGFGGMAGVFAGHPLDTLKIRLQQPKVTALARPPPSALGLLNNIVKTEGPLALYRGMAPPLASVALQVTCYALCPNEFLVQFFSMGFLYPFVLAK